MDWKQCIFVSNKLMRYSIGIRVDDEKSKMHASNVSELDQLLVPLKF